MKKLTITVNILDYWLVDNYKLGMSYKCYMLVEINDTLKLMERDV